MVGETVWHIRLGECVVYKLADGGRTLYVYPAKSPSTPYYAPLREFEIRREKFPVGTVTPAGAPSTKASPPKGPPDAPAGAQAEIRARGDWAKWPRADARQALEALRLGVVPRQGLARLTVGRDKEVDRISFLAKDARGMLVVSGGYGSGKSHLIELAEAEALANGMLVARATFDPREVPPSHPMRIYAALMASLRYPEGTATGIGPLFDKLSGSNAHVRADGAAFNPWLSPALWAHTHWPGHDFTTELTSLVTGGPGDHRGIAEGGRRAGGPFDRFHRLSDYRTFGQIMANLLGAVACWARDAGYRGVMVLLDEAEYFDSLESTSRQMAENVLKYLALACVPAAELPFKESNLYRGGHASLRSVRTRFLDNQPLAVVCAFTPNPTIDAALAGVVHRDRILALEPLGVRAFPALVASVLAIVSDAHPEIMVESADRDRLVKSLRDQWDLGNVASTRQAARLVIEYSDLYRDSPDRARRALVA